MVMVMVLPVQGKVWNSHQRGAEDTPQNLVFPRIFPQGHSHGPADGPAQCGHGPSRTFFLKICFKVCFHGECIQ